MTNQPNTSTSTGSRGRRWAGPAAVLAVLALGATFGLFWFFSGDAPAEVDLQATASSVTGDDTGDVVGTDAGGIDGVWSVDTSIGEFTVEGTTTASFVGFRVDEVLSSIGKTTAVGRTPEVSGSIVIEGNTLVEAEVTADLTAMVSDQSRREDSIQRALNTSATPEATFVLTEPIGLGEGAAEGEPVEVTAVGELTIKGVTNQIDISLAAQVIDGAILVTGSTDVVFADYDVAVPSSQIVLSVEEQGVVELQLWLTR